MPTGGLLLSFKGEMVAGQLDPGSAPAQWYCLRGQEIQFEELRNKRLKRTLKLGSGACKA